jgi:methionyl-tRNA formyltransferase
VTRASEWPRRRPSDGIIDWATRVPALDAWIRAQTRPYPGAFSFLGDAKVTIWQARPLGTGEGPSAGTVVAAADDGVEVRCGDGSILLEEVDLEEVGNLHGAAIGEHLRPGTVLG